MNNDTPENIKNIINIVAEIVRRIVDNGLDKAPQASFNMEASKEGKNGIERTT